MEFVKNRVGGDLLVHEGFIYKKNKQRGDNIYWLCTKYKTEHCTGRCKSSNGVVEVTNKNHNHTVDPSEVDTRKRLATLKTQTLNTQDLPCQITTQVVLNASRGVAASLPSTALLTRTINRTRKCKSTAPANPTSLTDLQIPEEYTRSASGQPFFACKHRRGR